MSQFTSGFWDLYIAVISVVSIIACAVFLKVQSVRKAGASGREAETSGHTWDEDLTEYNNPLPRWWAWLFYITIAFALGYLALYPGLGSYSGTLGWTQVNQLEEETQAANARFGPIYEKYAAQDVAAVAQSPEALAIGQKLFLNNCAQCHASDGGGGRGFPNLTDRDWQWGGTPEAIKTTITDGRTGVMPPMGAAIGGDEGAKDAAHYVLSLSGRTHDSLRAFRGKTLFQQACVACHGAEGKGNPQLGALNLTDGVWLHGSSEAAIIEQILKGRASQMPAHKDVLSPAKIHLLTAYVYGLSQQGTGGK
ncbi:MAG: cytochrome-c oxidase, cbb3-type subunit III [Betaproteobacteria bacterium RIFCSPLOWO2_02_FULL_67_26]|nr:MAG: cytochrome-c oxidase, cbb3-type subunit III [Betaproteobacteria bacterium RIFCSPLOWO2_02_FULL_67_26]